MPRVVHFEFATDDPERAAAFYQEVSGWDIMKWGGPVDYRLATTGTDTERGINGAIRRRSPGGSLTVVTVEVPLVDAALGKVAKAGGKVITGKMPILGVGYHAYCQDTEGTIFGIMEADERARQGGTDGPADMMSVHQVTLPRTGMAVGKRIYRPSSSASPFPCFRL